MSEIKDRTFESEATFQAYNDCVSWLERLGCSVGSMQRGAPTAVMFADNYDISKNRNLSAPEKNETHGWIHSYGGRFRYGPIVFKVSDAGKRFLANRAEFSAELVAQMHKTDGGL